MSRSLLCAGALGLGLASAQTAPEERRFLLVVSGLGGEAYYDELFRRWSLNLLEIAHQRYALDDRDTLYLAAPADAATAGASGEAASDGESDKRSVLAAIAELGRRSAPGDRVLVVLLGHGTAQGPDVRFNLPGPDLSPQELAEALQALPGRRLAVVNTTPSSAPFLDALSAPGRVVITATANAGEAEHTRFAGFFIEALASTEADADKDRVVSLWEAFAYAKHQLAAAYQAEGRLLTEHAQLDDDGDRRGTREAQALAPPQLGAGDGALARRFDLAGLDGGEEDADPQRAAARLALQLEARRLVDGVERLKREKPTYLAQSYYQRLEELLVELALNRRAYAELAPP